MLASIIQVHRIISAILRYYNLYGVDFIYTTTYEQVTITPVRTITLYGIPYKVACANALFGPPFIYLVTIRSVPPVIS